MWFSDKELLSVETQHQQCSQNLNRWFLTAKRFWYKWRSSDIYVDAKSELYIGVRSLASQKLIGSLCSQFHT